MFISSKKTLLHINRLLILTLSLGLFFLPKTNSANASENLKPSIPGDQIVTRPEPMELMLLDSQKEQVIFEKPLFASLNKNRKPILTRLDAKNIYSQILKKSKEFYMAPKKGRLIIENSDKITDFSPDAAGISIDPVASSIKVIKRPNVKMDPVTIQTSSAASLASSNSLGINALLARGTSNFKGSSKNRRINIRVAVEKMRGVLVAPGENFSFNEHLGDVLAKDGFVPEIVIKKDGLFPELGGGVCQVSSTVFRAAMASGMPIIERKNHSFPVNHYTPIGSDATVYTGVVDFKFTNDTPRYILIWPHFPDEDTLYFDIYGTGDGRKVEIKDPVKYGFQSNGIFKTKWERTVQRPGMDTRTDSLVSTYLPASWFKKEEKFVPTQPPSDNPPPAIPPAPTDTQIRNPPPSQ